MSPGLTFGILGRLQVSSEGVSVPIPEGKQRAVLAILLLRAGRIVSADQLAELLWAPSAPPPSARPTVRNYVKRLRAALGATARDRIVTDGGGYLIRVGPGELDASQLEQRLVSARAAARKADWPEVDMHAASAVALWRGEPLSDVYLPAIAAAEGDRLTGLRLEAEELQAEAALQLGRHAEAVTGLHQLAVASPLREHLHALLMIALYRCGRRGEALAAYRRARDLLVEDLGSEPGPELRDLHRLILRDDPALMPPTPGVAATPARDVPRQLPTAVRCFTGRQAELATLTGMLGEPGASYEPAMVISAIGGTAGVGKTALAVQWAHQVAARFPDGQLYVNLHGYDLVQPMAAGDALAGFLRTLGVPGPDIPDELQERARLYRSRLAGRRMLVLLDNARDGAQVRPLLPGDPGCAAVITSRDTLAGLVAAEGARRLDLDVLPLADAVALLRELIGDRVDADPTAAAALAGLCARLPLALRIAAELAAARPDAPLDDLATELQAARLDALDAGEEQADIRAVFSWSVRQLPGDAATAFAMLGLHPGEDLDGHAAAALTGTTTGQARRMLARLQRASLIEANGSGRYGMHDLLRAYAREQATEREADRSGRQALTRLFDYYLAAATAAMDIDSPAEARYLPRTASSTAIVPEMPGKADARAWLDNERSNLVAVVVHGADHGWPRHATDLAGTVSRYLSDGSHVPEGQIIYGHALQAARRSGDLAAEASALSDLAGISVRKGYVRDAVSRYQAALERYRRCANLSGEAETLHNLGVTYYRMHDNQTAIGYFTQAATVWEDAGDNLGAARTLTKLAGAEIEMDLRGKAAQHLQLALPVLREAQDQSFEAAALGWMGELASRSGQLTAALDLHEQALAIYRRIDHPPGMGRELNKLAAIGLRLGEDQQAIGYLQQALGLCRQAGNRLEEILTLRKLAEALHRVGQPATARADLEAAAQLAAETGSTYQQASAHRDLADSYHAAGEDEQAHHHGAQALDLYTQLDAPEAAHEVQSRLSTQETTTRPRHGAEQ